MSYRLCKIILTCGNCGEELQDKVLVHKDGYYMKCPYCKDNFQGIQDMWQDEKELEEGN